MVAGPYRAGSSDPEVWAENLRVLNASANAVFRKGHVPIVGVNMALPMIERAGSASYEAILMPLSLGLTERCDAILRIEGASKGADAEVERFRQRGRPVFRALDEIPDAAVPSRALPLSAYMARLRVRIGHDLLLICAAASYVFDADGRVLLIRHAEGGRWTNPGGMVEPFETPADAAVRETWEETGLLVELTRFIGVFGGHDHHITYANGDEVTYLAFAFAAKVVGGSLVPDRTEVLEARYVTRDEAWALDLSPPVRRALAIAFDGGDRVHFDAPTWAPVRGEPR